MAPLDLAAAYTSPSGNKAFSIDLPSLPAPGPQLDLQTKTEYLSSLRASIQTMQGQINGFLTQKMEEDKAAETGSAQAKSKKDEEREEEMYGEELEDEDA